MEKDLIMNKLNKFFLGIDIGSTTVKTAILDEKLNIVAKTYTRSNGESLKTACDVLKNTFSKFPAENFYSMGVTGSGSKTLGDILNIPNINELVAQTESVKYFYPEVKTIIEMGGQDSKFILLNKNEKTGNIYLEDFGLNDLCAAGTGSFLDQQADRLHIDIEKDFSRLAASSENPAKIAGRCTVFAKSDMIHLQQISTPIQDIVAGLCYAVARNFMGVVAKGKKIKKPVIFQGGVAYNKGMIRAFEDVLGLKRGELIIPEHHTVMAAIGIALISKSEVEKNGNNCFKFNGLDKLEKFLDESRLTGKSHPNLNKPTAKKESDFSFDQNKNLSKYAGLTVPVYIGVDTGSVSTNIVLLDDNKELVIKKYKKTNGEPIKVVTETLLTSHRFEHFLHSKDSCSYFLFLKSNPTNFDFPSVL